MLQDLLLSNHQVTVAVSIGELKQFADYLINKTKSELEDQITAQRQERYLTAKEVGKILSINPSTVCRWRSRGYLVPCEIGGQRRYKLSDVNALLDNPQKGGRHE